MKPKVIAIVGPTASGKTAMSIELAKRINGEIVSADSRLVYKGFDIASAKPTLEEREGIPHYLIDIVEPEFDYSVGNYYDDAKNAIYKILSKGKTPIIVGGTGLYFRILLENYNLPRVEANYELRAELDKRDKEYLLEELKQLDKITYERLYDSNKRRIVRALEVIKLLNKPILKFKHFLPLLRICYNPLHIRFHRNNQMQKPLICNHRKNSSLLATHFYLYKDLNQVY